MLLFFQKVTRDIDVALVRGIGFDATCSLVALDGNFQPVAVNQTGDKLIFVVPTVPVH